MLFLLNGLVKFEGSFNDDCFTVLWSISHVNAAGDTYVYACVMLTSLLYSKKECRSMCASGVVENMSGKAHV